MFLFFLHLPKDLNVGRNPIERVAAKQHGTPVMFSRFIALINIIVNKTAK
jgi:hypothetical protein